MGTERKKVKGGRKTDSFITPGVEQRRQEENGGEGRI
jgi:hypothetical protein